ncbi:putative disease resistance protein RGA4, partial [Triticum dicoccoides]|uniref:putative disease resistance protein RGA4 n=1 Tax=Triticum dicoccoides TaxID=85692 RepID=UPI00188F8553
EKLKKSLSGKRFFLILDDIWVKTRNDPQLEELISPLNVGMKGSKILVTARTEVAARTLCTDEPIKMPDLDEVGYLLMFMHYALGGTNVVEVEFVPVAWVIAKKLHRSPIAAVTVAGQLRAHPDILFWKNTANLDLLNDTMGSLFWSYQQLNPDIKRCLEYCNIFPRRSKLTRDELIHLWIAQGFLKTSCATEDMEDVAEGYVQELVSCSFLQLEKSWYETDQFRIHDLMHDLLDKITGRDYLIIENAESDTAEGWKGVVPRDVRHLSVQNYDGELIIKNILRLECLRTLIIYGVERSRPFEVQFFENICKRLPKLRVLVVQFSLEYDPVEQPIKFSISESISHLKHLRYLALKTNASCTVYLPWALTKLHRIQLLHFSVEIFEFSFPGLINLRHVFSRSKVKFRNIGSLISLQTIPHFTVRNEQGYEVKQLRDLNKLCGSLDIYGLKNVKSKEEALEANLASKERLTKLTLSWDGDDGTRCSPEVEADVLEGMCPPVGLETLVIRHYKGTRYPYWNGTPKDLQNLHFIYCGQLGCFPGLEAFCHLRSLHLLYCDWYTLPGNMEHLTSLKKLEIISCHYIQSLPTLPESLEEFELLYCNDEFMESCQTVGHPNWQKIEQIPEKRFNPIFLKEEEEEEEEEEEG